MLEVLFEPTEIMGIMRLRASKVFVYKVWAYETLSLVSIEPFS